MIVLDAGVLIAHLDGDDALHERAVERLLELAEHPFGCSPITRAEALVGPARAGRLEAAQRALSALGVVDLGLPPDAAAELARLRAGTGLRLPDCCVLLAAQAARARAVVTFDDRLARQAARAGFVE